MNLQLMSGILNSEIGIVAQADVSLEIRASDMYIINLFEV